jgi:four helix bundle protein
MMNQHDDKQWYFPAERLDAYRVARELVREVARVSENWRGWSELRDQAKAASTSAMLNLAEGAAQTSFAVKRRHFDIAMGSAGETYAALDAADAVGLPAGRGLAIARQLGALIGGLLRYVSR